MFLIWWWAPVPERRADRLPPRIEREHQVRGQQPEMHEAIRDLVMVPQLVLEGMNNRYRAGTMDCPVHRAKPRDFVDYVPMNAILAFTLEPHDGVSIYAPPPGG